MATPARSAGQIRSASAPNIASDRRGIIVCIDARRRRACGTAAADDATMASAAAAELEDEHGDRCNVRWHAVRQIAWQPFTRGKVSAMQSPNQNGNVKANQGTSERGEERILGRKLARELTQDELSMVSGGHTPGPGETCSGNDCDVVKC
jgi:hypothetical protein